MKKKLLSLVMACALVLSLAIPALADTYYTYEEAGTSLTPDGIVFTAKTHVPTVSLAMPALVSTSSPLVLNPYKLTYTGSNDTLNDKAVGNAYDQQRQVISPIYSIENKTDVALKFAVKATTELGSSAAFTFNSSHVSLTERTKKAFIQLVLKKTEEATAAPTAFALTTAAQELDPFDTANYETVVLAEGDKSTNNSQLKRLAAASSSSANYLQFQFQGSLSRTPETGWTADDIFTTTLEFTFTPESGQDYTATVTDIAVGSASQKPTDDLGADVKIELDTAIATAFDSTNSKAYFATLKDASGNTAKNKAGATVSKPNELASATPSWSLISAGAFGATINGTNGEITYPKAMGKTLTGSGTGAAPVANANGNNQDFLIIGFNDFNGVPRTIGVTVDIAYTTKS